MRYGRWISATAIATLCALACSKEKEAKAPEQTMAPAALEEEPEESVKSVTPSEAAAPKAIADARCERELRCENVGAGRKYSTMDDCRKTVQADWQGDLSARECPKGIDNTALSQCLEAIRTEDCGSPFDSLERVVECNAGDICQD